MIELKNISVTFQQKQEIQAVQDVSLTIDKGISTESLVIPVLEKVR